MTEVELTRRARKKDETRTRIFRAAIKLFRDRGFDATTIDEITERADVAKGTFFNYFPRKEAVLAYLGETWLGDAEESADALLAEARSTREKILSLYAGLAASYAEERELSWIVIQESMRRAFQPTEDVHHRWRALMARLLEQGKASGELRTDLDFTRTHVALASVYMGTLIEWLGCPVAAFELQPELAARLGLVFDGLAATRGRP